MATFYVTKYALSGGILVIESEAETKEWDGGEWVKDPRRGHFNHYTVGREAFRTESEAMADAEKRRTAKIASLEKQIAKLRALKISTKDGASHV